MENIENNWWHGFISEINDHNFFIELKKPFSEIKYIAEFPISVYSNMVADEQKMFRLGQVVDVNIHSGKINFIKCEPLTEDQFKEAIDRSYYWLKNTKWE